jgi:preprotein translocase subunit SecG
MKAGIEWCAALCDSFLVFGLRVFSTVLPNFYLKAGIEWCAALFWFLSLCLVLRVFFNSPTHSTYESRDWWCAALCDSFGFGLKSIFQQSTQFLPMSRLVMLLFLWFLSLCLVLEYFSTVLPNLPMKAGLSDVLLFCDSFLCVWS